MIFFLFNAPETAEQLPAVPEQNMAINTLPSKYCIIYTAAYFNCTS